MKNQVMQQRQRGFTLIELVVVIVILGILAATALPKFMDMTDDAKVAATRGVAGALSGGFSINYSGRKASVGVSPSKGVAVTNCNGPTLASIIQGGLPPGYTVNNSPIASDTAADCTLTSPDGTTASYIVMGIN